MKDFGRYPLVDHLLDSPGFWFVILFVVVPVVGGSLAILFSVWP